MSIVGVSDDAVHALSYRMPVYGAWTCAKRSECPSRATRRAKNCLGCFLQNVFPPSYEGLGECIRSEAMSIENLGFKQAFNYILSFCE